MKKWKQAFLFLFCITLLLISACGEQKNATEETKVSEKKSKGQEEKKETMKLKFVDAHGQWYETEIREDLPKHGYEVEHFLTENGRMTYTGEGYTYKQGVDVSKYQGAIDWNKVKADGFDFAFLRIGFRGYGEEGKLVADDTFVQNYDGAKAAGLQVGVYFFSQAVNEKEAEEEARFTQELLAGRPLDLPVVYDPEHILNDEARTDNVSGEQFTKNAKRFCETIQASGYEPMIYANMLWEAYELDLKVLGEYEIWYADYEAKPQTPYPFTFWQYTSQGQVDGIEGPTDLNIWMCPV